MKEASVQRIVHSYIDPDEHDFLCINLESDIISLVEQEVTAAILKCGELMAEMEQKHKEEIARMNKRARIVRISSRRKLLHIKI